MDKNVMDAATRAIRTQIADEQRGMVLAQERINALTKAVTSVEQAIARFEKAQACKHAGDPA
ncbi:hypothetical protein [Gluconobacter cerinus]|uniref:hypothetical protein n=1 Tax=Gluconobacter cerinus TaxID=38307 RepID=UPI001B8B8AC4|nr:hypothetical protein [Gluconobacter cerinus]MBS1067290.1 hypothetical protein [Gluconobacter cerinus]